jgi:hypothetical protein
MKIGEAFTVFAKAAGLDLTEAKYADILAIQGDMKEDILTIDLARNNPDLKAHFHAQAFNGIDATLDELAKTNGLTEEQITELKAEKTTGKRLNLFNKLVTESLNAKIKDAGKGNTQTAQAEIDRLTGELKTVKETYESKLAEKDKSLNDTLFNLEYDGVIGKHQLAVELSKDILRPQTLAWIAEKGAKVVRGEDGKLKLVNANDPTLDFTLNNDKPSVDGLVSALLAEKKLLKVTDPAGNGGADNKNNGGQQRHIDPNANSQNNAYLETLRQSQEADKNAVGV